MITVVHDPGHGYKGDPGCCHAGIIEANYVLSLAQAIAVGVPSVGHHLLRVDANGPDYPTRARRAKELGADIVLLHHVNANESPDCRGLMAFYDHGDLLAADVAMAIARAAPTPIFRGIPTIATRLGWPRVLWCLDHYRALGLSAVLIEWGFGTSPKDAAYLENPINRPALIATAAAGLAKAAELKAARLSS